MVRGVSGGEKKRVTTGEILVGGARVLLMDEISTGAAAMPRRPPVALRAATNFCRRHQQRFDMSSGSLSLVFVTGYVDSSLLSAQCTLY